MVLADLIGGSREVHIAGPHSFPLWTPLASRADLNIVGLSANPLAASRFISERFPTATFIASKPLLASFGVALLVRHSRILLDIDDPEIALSTADLRTFLSVILRSQSPVITASLIAIRDRAGAKTVSNSLLQARYGGTVVPHARDERLFSEEERDRARARRALGVSESRRLIVYVGTVRRHKGIDVLREAVRMMRHPVELAIIGGQPSGAAKHEIVQGPVDYRTALLWVAAADVIAVPQTDSRASRSQSPAKLGDALAVGRAIVTTRLDVIKEIVGDAALLAAPGSARDLSDRLTEVLTDDRLRLRLEAAARDRFETTLSFSVVRPKLLDVVARLEASS